MRVIDNETPDRMWGSYDFVDHGHDAREARPNIHMGHARRAMGDYEFHAMGIDMPQLPDIGSVLGPIGQIGQPTVWGKLQYVDSSLATAIEKALSATSFQPLETLNNFARGTIAPALPTTPSWAETARLTNAVLIDIASAKTTQPIFTITHDPIYIAQAAGIGGSNIILDINQPLEAAAQTAAGGAAIGPMIPPAPPGGIPLVKVALFGAGALAVVWWLRR